MTSRAVLERLRRLRNRLPDAAKVWCCPAHADRCPTANGAGWRLPAEAAAEYERVHGVALVDVECGPLYPAEPFERSGAPWEDAFEAAGLLCFPGTGAPTYLVVGVDLRALR